jgi:preprotein translocase subunit YajC
MSLPIAIHPALLAALQGGTSGSGQLFILVAMFAIFYFLLIRPQQQQRKKHEAALMDISKGDEIVTAGGIVGEVLSMRETVKDGTASKTLEDRVTIKSGESKLVVERGRIAKVLGANGSVAKD